LRLLVHLLPAGLVVFALANAASHVDTIARALS
jgi:hypothetical protein